MRFHEFSNINSRSRKSSRRPRRPLITVPTAVKQQALGKKLAAVLARAAFSPRVTRQDVRIAAQHVEQQQKRADLDYQAEVDELQRQQDRERKGAEPLRQ